MSVSFRNLAGDAYSIYCSTVQLIHFVLAFWREGLATLRLLSGIAWVGTPNADCDAGCSHDLY